LARHPAWLKAAQGTVRFLKASGGSKRPQITRPT
jgi:hypothetical protein